MTIPGAARLALGAARRLRRALRGRLPPVVRTAWGGLWLNADDVITRRMRGPEGFEVEEQQLLLRLLRPGMIFLDIGANHGFFSLLAARRVGGRGAVIAFEPSPRELRRLHAHLLLNRCWNVRVEPLALGRDDARERLFVCERRESGCNSLRPPAVDGPLREVTVEVTSLDGYLRRRGLAGADFVKLDVEGAELDVLSGAAGLLSGRERPPILCEIADIRTRPWGYEGVRIYDLLEAYGYRWHAITPGGGLRPCPRKERYHENLLAVPPERAAALAALMEEP